MHYYVSHSSYILPWNFIVLISKIHRNFFTNSPICVTGVRTAYWYILLFSNFSYSSPKYIFVSNYYIAVFYYCLKNFLCSFIYIFIIFHIFPLLFTKKTTRKSYLFLVVFIRVIITLSGGERGVRTLAPITRPNSLANLYLSPYFYWNFNVSIPLYWKIPLFFRYKINLTYYNYLSLIIFYTLFF